MSNLLQRIIVGLVSATIYIFLIFYQGSYSNILFFTVLLFLIIWGAKEFCNLFQLYCNSKLLTYIVVSITSLISILYFLFINSTSIIAFFTEYDLSFLLGYYNFIFSFPFFMKLIIFLFFLPFIMVVIIYLLLNKVDGVQVFVSILLLGVVYITLPFISLLYLRISDFSIFSIVILSSMSFSSDIGGYVIGRLFGKHKINWVVSPNKTYEGYIGGFIFQLIFTFFIFKALLFLTPVPNITYLTLFILSVIIYITSVLGDLFISFLKREAHVSNSSNMLPGHGGLLDLIDFSCLFTPHFYSNYALVELNTFVKKKVIVLGVTGSIGDSTLKVIRAYPDFFELIAISYHTNFQKAKQILEEFKVPHICCTNNEQNINIPNSAKFYSDIINLLDIQYDLIVIGVVGAAGLKPTLYAIEQEKVILLANKETLVIAGALVLEVLSKYPQATLLPIDSEHNSLFRICQDLYLDPKYSSMKSVDIKQLILTASGGPLFDKKLKGSPTREEILKHPTWSMGDKITVDSATMMNKAFEVIEAHYLFNFDYSKISAVIHRQSFIHAMIQHSDGSFTTHMSLPDMIYPIAYAMFYPKPSRIIVPLLEAAKIPSLDFYPIEKEKYPAYFLALEVAVQKGVYPAILYTANSIAVDLFLKDKISFKKIPLLLERVLNKVKSIPTSFRYEDILEVQTWAKDKTYEVFRSI